jgi:3'-5' exoribonuclease
VTAPPISIPALGVGERVQDTFLVWDVETRTLSDGSPYAILQLANSTGRAPTAPFWSADLPKIEGVTKGTVVDVTAEVQEYRGARQLKVVALRPVPTRSADLQRLLPSVGDVAPWWRLLERWRGEMKDGPWQRAGAAFFDDPDFRTDFERCPASLTNHHAQLGGLLKHTVEVAFIAQAIGRTCGADWDALFAGVLLHDIGKLEAYRWDGVFQATDAGALLGHLTLGALMLERRLATLTPPLTPLERARLQHLVLSHHGRLEFGSPVRPMTLEAEVLHLADTASASTANVADALRDPANFPEGGTVSRSLWTLDHRKLYRRAEGS